MTDRDGILNKSPLIYALASVRFAPWAMIAKKIDEIQDDLREIAPLMQHIQVHPSGLSGQGGIPETATQSVWMLMPSDRSYGIHLSSDQLLVFSSQYRRYADFENIISRVLEVLLKYMRFIDVINTGVRYIDHIKMHEGKRFGDYIAANASLQPASLLGFDQIGGVVMGSYKAGDVVLRVRCINHPDNPAVPEDLIATIAMTQEPGTPLQINMLKSNEILLDMDAIKNYPNPQRMDKQSILKQLNRQHQIANTFFRHKDVCTDYAFSVWRGEK